MSLGQQIYRMIRSLIFVAILTLNATLLSGCSDPQEKAREQGAQAQALFDAGHITEARQAIKKAVATRDDILDLYLLYGRIEAAAGSADTAFGAYNNALSLDSSNGEALMGVAQFGMQSGNLRDSERAADHILTLEPEQPNALLIKGIYEALHNRGDKALSNAETILAKDPTSESAVILKARALSILDRPDEALQVMETAKRTTKASVGIARTLLELYRYNNNGPAMLGQFQELRRFTPRDIPIVLDQANTLYKLGETAQARAILQGLMLNPKIGDGNARLVTDLWAEHDNAPLDAAAMANLAQKANKPAKRAAVRYYLNRKDIANALLILGDPGSDADLIALRAQAAIQQGNIAPGARMAEQILDDDKTNCDALLARAQASLASRRYTDAIIASQVVNADCPRITPAFVVLAKANEAAGNKMAADLAFREGIKRNSQDSQLARIYADWLEGKGNGTRAVATAHRLTNAAPALVSGWQLYLDLCTKNPDETCAEDAKAGLAAARQRFAVDRRPDDPETPSLFSQLKQQKPL